MLVPTPLILLGTSPPCTALNSDPPKGRLEIGKPAPMVPTYLVLSGKKSARWPPAEIFNSKKHAKTHEPPS
jgi:hypothetical protein